MADQIDDVDGRVLSVATRFFAELGYDATPLNLIAEAVGTDAERSSLLQAGRKQELYHSVLAHLYDLELAHMEAAAREAPDGIAGLHLLVDAFMDFITEHPETPAIWWHRVLNDAADLRFPEMELPPPFLKVITENPRWGTGPEMDLDVVSWTIMWSMTAFVNDGFFNPSGIGRPAAYRPPLDRFRAQLHHIVDRLA